MRILADYQMLCFRSRGEWTCLVGEGHLVVGVGLADLVGVGLPNRLLGVGAELPVPPRGR